MSAEMERRYPILKSSDGFSYHQFGAHGEGDAVVIPVGAQGIYNQVAGSLAQQTGRHIHGGQRRMNEGGLGDVVEGNNRDILRDPYALFQKPLNNSVSN